MIYHSFVITVNFFRQLSCRLTFSFTGETGIIAPHQLQLGAPHPPAQSLFIGKRENQRWAVPLGIAPSPYTSHASLANVAALSP